MSTTVTYKGNTLTTATNQTRVLETAGKYMEDDVTIIDVTSSPSLQSKSKSYTPTETAQSETVTYDSGYDGLSQVSVSVGAISSSYVGSGITRRTSSDLSASGATVTAPAGYYPNDATKTVASGSATPASTISATGATLSTGTNTLTLSKSVSNTPTVSAGYISSGTAGNSSVSLTASVNTRSSSDLTASTLTVTAPSGYYSSNATKTLSDQNLVAGNIKKDVSIFGVTGTYEGGGGGNNVSEAGSYADTVSSTTLVFNNLLGEPTSFVIFYEGTMSTPSDTTYRALTLVYDGTTMHAQTLTSTNNAQVSYNSSSFSYIYSNGTLTVTSSSPQFISGTWAINYTYGGTSSNVNTVDVQVGSGATSITFTGLTDEPICWYCIFKSNFSTSSGYQRVIWCRQSGIYNNLYGHAMDSSAKLGQYWSASYNNGSLTITSQGTNSGGYFHQPGYYQLTYVIGDPSPYEKVSKTYRASTTAQSETITPSSGYDAIEQVSVSIPAVTQTNLTAANIKSGTTVTISNGQSNLWSVTGTYTGGGGGSASIDTKTTTSSNRPTSLSFTSMLGQPQAFFLRCTSSMSRSSSSTYYYVATMRYNGTNTTGNCWRMSNGNWTNITSGYSFTYSGTTLTLSSSGTTTTSPGCFYPGNYELVYIY